MTTWTKTLEFMDGEVLPFIIRTKPHGEAVAILKTKHWQGGNNLVMLVRHGYILSDGGHYKDILGLSPEGLWCIELIRPSEFNTYKEFGLKDITKELEALNDH